MLFRYRELAAGWRGAAALVIGQTLAILYDRVFLLYQSRLVPRVLPLVAPFRASVNRSLKPAAADA